MNDKLKDSEDEVRKTRNEYEGSIENYRKYVPVNGIADTRFTVIMNREAERTWTIGKKKNQNKIDTLLQRRKRGNAEREPNHRKNREETRSIKYKDDELDEFEKQNTPIGNNKPEVYGGVSISDKSEIILSKEPRFMIFEKIDDIEVEVEIEKGISKARYELMNRGDDSDESPDEEDSAMSNNRKQEGNKILNYKNLRATDIPTVQRLIEPKLGTMSEELVMESTKEKLLDCVRQYKGEFCNNKGEIKEDNLSNEERQGLKQIKRDIKDKKVVVFTTDKSGKFSVDTPSNYNEAVQKHTTKDEEVTEKDGEKKVETLMNHHMKQFNKMFKVGSTHGHEVRVAGATTSTNTPAPPMYGLRKDHKAHDNKEIGPPVRPVCGASDSPNSRLSNFLSRVINDFADKIGIETECRSSEEMKAAFEQYNNEDEDVRKRCQVISMDVKALYPSMEVEEVVKAVREMVESSEDQPDDVDWWEVGKYLAVTMTKEEIERERLVHVIPRRKKGPDRKVSVAYLSNKQNEGNWNTTRVPGHIQKRKMLGIAIASGVKACMRNHLYKVGDKIYRQKEG